MIDSIWQDKREAIDNPDHLNKKGNGFRKNEP